MSTDPMSPEVLVSAANEIEAAAIVTALDGHGIRARAIGGYTSGFRAEAPGAVKVVVGRADLARAQTVLAEIRGEHAAGDPSTADSSGGPSPLGQREMRDAAEAAPGHDRAGLEEEQRPFQFSIASLLVLQTIVSLALAAWRVIHRDLDGALALFSIAYLAFLVVAVPLILAGTVGIASDLNRARKAWRYVGRATAVGIAVVALLFVCVRIAAYVADRL